MHTPATLLATCQAAHTHTHTAAAWHEGRSRLPLTPACLQLSAVRRGNIPLAMTDHTLVLGWNRQAPLLLRQIGTSCHGDSRVLGRWAA